MATFENGVFRDDTHHLEKCNDNVMYKKKFRFQRQFIFELAEEQQDMPAGKKDHDDVDNHNDLQNVNQSGAESLKKSQTQRARTAAGVGTRERISHDIFT